jgi:haloalkane dehalogenase
MTAFVRTPDSAFSGIDDFSCAPNYHQWHDLRMHYIDEGPKDGPVMLMLHGMPTWSYLYRHLIPPLVKAGYRCIAPDHMGFGRSDKPTDSHWYTIARHTEVLTSLIVDLDLNNITLICQDWGGPTGLAQAAMMPERFDRLTIMNTWLHHDDFEYSESIQGWIKNWQEGGYYCREKPDMGATTVLYCGLLNQQQMDEAMLENKAPELSGEAERMYRAYSAPHASLDDAAYNGLRRFPLSIPFDNYNGGNGAAQSFHYKTLLDWKKPAHFIWGCADPVFVEEWGRLWASRMNATFDPIPEAGHFLQNTHGKEVAELLLGRISQE